MSTPTLAATPGGRAGLPAEVARSRLAADGPNVLAAAEPPHWALRFARNLTHLFAMLLWAAAVLALVGDMPELAAAIVAVIVVNAVFSFAQEFRAERAVAALSGILPHRVRVRRDGRQTEVASEEIVVGDVVLLSAGDRVPADARVVWDARLRVDMSTLTGESEPVTRRAGRSEREGIEALDRVFAGTYVASGAAEAVVTTTGMATELGRISGLTAAAGRHDSPLELEMQRMTRVVAALSVTLGFAFFLLAGSLGMGTNDRFLFAIGVIVANVPEGLLPTVTHSLALASSSSAAAAGAPDRTRVPPSGA
jgi:P-type E1-E2 ATPase